jgi:tRNA1(Val) A37 N6-methylase TrmN6
MELLALESYHKYMIGNKEIKIQTSPEVWSPYSAVEMLNFLQNHGYFNSLENKKILDLGTGSGIIGIYCAMLENEVYVSDYSSPAVQDALKNANLNGCEIKGVVSNCFESLEGKIFDTILSNPPVQPWLFTDLKDLEHRPTSASWNEAGADGRLVLDILIKEGKNYLTENGNMIISSSTRHGHRQTIELLNQNWQNWQVIYASEHELDPDYHAPYFPSWLKLQEKDLDLRVYQKDEEGRKFAIQTDENGESYIITRLEINDKMINVRLKHNGEEWQAFDKDNHFLMPLAQHDSRMPNKPINENWYYQYFLIECKKN